MTAAGAASEAGDKLRDLEARGRQAVRKVSPWVTRLGRFGLAAKGAVYLIVGWLALQPAIRGGGQPTDKQGVLHSILRQPFGTAMLAIVCGGLFAYMVWRIVQALFNPDGEPNDLKGGSKRVFRLGSGMIYGGVGVAAARLLIGMQASRQKPSDWTAMFMRWPAGKWLVAVAGLAVMGYGLFRIWKAWKGELKQQLVLDRYAARARTWIIGLGRFGQGARGVVFAIIGAFTFYAGLHTNPSEAKGIAESLGMIERAPYGPYLLGLVAAGLIAYGLFQFIEARYRRIHPD